ncbi:MAG: phage tail tape measure protein [Nitrosopumilus sp.]|nr:phage tail tape measure protein [Nitrosopumilus sp.]
MALDGGAELGELILKVGIDTGALKRDLNKTKAQVEGTSAGIEKKVSASFTGMALKVGKSLAAVFAIGELAKFSRAMVTTAANFEQAMADVAAITGATGKNFEDMSALAQTMGKTTVFTATQSADALKFLGMAGLNATQSMAALPGVLNLAAAGGIDIATAADLATNVLGGMGLEIDQLNRVNDVMANTASRSNTNILELAGALRIAGPVAAATGETIEQVAAVLGGMANQGIKAETAGQAYKQMLSRLITAANGASDAIDENGESVGKAQDALSKYGITLKTADGAMRPFIDILKDMKEKNIDAAAAQDIFGRFTFSSALAAKSAADAMAALAEQNDRAAGSAEKMARIKLDTFWGDVTLLSSAFEGLMLSMGGAFTEADSGRAIIRVLTDTVGFFNDEVNRSGGTLSGIFSTGLELAVNGGIVFSKVLIGIITSIKWVTQGIRLLMDAVIIGLVGAFEGAVLAVEIFLKALSKIPGMDSALKDITISIEQFRNKISGVSDAVSKTAEETAEGFKEIGAQGAITFEGLDKIGENFYANMAGARNRDLRDTKTAETAKKNAVVGASSASSSAVKKLTAAYVDLSGAIHEINKMKMVNPWDEEGYKKSITDSVEHGRDEFESFFHDLERRSAKGIRVKAAVDLGKFYGGYNTSVRDLISSIRGKMTTALVGAFGESKAAGILLVSDMAGQLTTSLIDGLTSGVSYMLNTLEQGVTMLYNVLISAFDTIITLPQKMRGFFEDLANSVESFPEALDSLAADLPNIINRIIEAAPKVAQAIADNAGAIIDALVSGIPKILPAFLNIIKSFIKALGDNLDKIIPAIMDIIDYLISEIPTFIDKTIEYLPDIIDSLVKLVKKLIPVFVQIIKTLLQAIVDNLDIIVAAIVDIIMALIDFIIDNIHLIIPALLKIVMTLITSIISKIPDIIDALTDMSPELSDMITDLAGTLIDAIIEMIPRLITSLYRSVLVSLEVTYKAIVNGLSRIWEWIKDKGPKAWESIKTAIGNLTSQLWTWVKEKGGQIWSSAKNAIGNLWEQVKKTFDFKKLLQLKIDWGKYGGQGSIEKMLNIDIPFLSFSQGGPVPGVGNSDSVPAMLTPGEFVLTKDVANSLGLGGISGTASILGDIGDTINKIIGGGGGSNNNWWGEMWREAIDRVWDLIGHSSNNNMFKHAAGVAPGAGAASFGGGADLFIPQLGNGGIVDKPTLAMIGESGPEEVRPLNSMPSIVVNVGGTVVSEMELLDAIEIGLRKRKLMTHGLR